MELVDVRGVRAAVRQRWRNGSEWDERALKVVVGELADGRWYARRWSGGVTDEHIARAYGGEHAEWLARGTARRWMRTVGGEWAEVQAEG